MLILLAGAAGQLGHELKPRLEALGKVVCVDRVNPGKLPGFLAADLGDRSATEILLNRVRPDVVVNAAAYTAVDRAESDRATAFRINADLPACMARWCARNDRSLLHYSTDYVFSGRSGRPYTEADAAEPINVYGESKRAGELLIAESDCRHLVLRSSWVYSVHGNNFVLTMLKLAGQRPELNIVNDQVGCPTWARNLATASVAALQQLLADASKSGLYHYCDADVVSWLDFARLIFSTAAGLGLLERAPQCLPVESSAFQQAARRPAYSAMDTSRIRQQLGIEPAPLETSLRACLNDLVKTNDTL
jgi:dTDP-4-dehydrorhamnose reductase